MENLGSDWRTALDKFEAGLTVEARVRATMEEFAKERPFQVYGDSLLKIKGVNDDFSFRMVDLDGATVADYDLGDNDGRFISLDEAVDEYLAGADKQRIRRRLRAL